MKKVTLAFLIVSCFFLLVFVNTSFLYTETSKPLSGSTGAPGEQTCSQSGCHVGNPTNVEVSAITLQSFGAGAPIANGYIPDSVHNLTLTIQQSLLPKFGFQMTALDQNNNKAGNLVRIESTFSDLTIYGNRQYISHKNATTQNAWTFKWETPPTDIGPVTFYFTACNADGDSTAAGDVVYAGAATVTTSSFTRLNVTGIQPVNADNVSALNIFPNPFSDQLTIEYFLHEENQVQIELFDLSGKMIKQFSELTETPGFHRHSFAFDEKPTAGVYLLRITEGKQVYFKKLLAE